MKIEITKRLTFEAAHFLEGYDGLCGHIHGHSYSVEVTLSGALEQLGQERGMVMDLSRLKKICQPIIEDLDHSLLVEHECHVSFAAPNPRVKVLGFRPTTENVAVWLAGQIQELLDGQAHLARVRVAETSTLWVDVIL